MKKKEHILVIPEWFPNEEDPQLGIFIEKQIRLIAEDFNVQVMYIKPDSTIRKRAEIKTEKGTYEVIRVYYKPSALPFMNFRRYLIAAKEGLKHIQHPDLIHLQVNGRNTLIQRLYLKNIPFVISEHWSGHLNHQKTVYLAGKSLAVWGYHHAKKVVAVSELLKSALERKFGRKDILVIPNLIEKADTITHPVNFQQIIVVADLVDEIKNISGILNALKQSFFEKHTRVLIIGDGPDRKELEEQARHISVPNLEIVFAGRKSNDVVLENIAQSDFMIVNSRKETFGMVAAEALYSGVPVICSRCGGPENFLHDKNSILVAVDSDQELVRAIHEMQKKYYTFDKHFMQSEIENRFGAAVIRNALFNLYQLSFRQHS